MEETRNPAKVEMMEFQWNLHQENVRRFDAMQSRQEEMMMQIATISANTKDMPSVINRVTDLEGSRERYKGGLAAVLFITPMLNWVVEKLFQGH